MHGIINTDDKKVKVSRKNDITGDEGYWYDKLNDIPVNMFGFLIGVALSNCFYN